MPQVVLPPGPPPRRKGPLGRVIYGVNFLLDPIGFVAGRFTQYGDVYYVPADSGPGLYVLRHPEHVRAVLIDEAAKFDKKHTGLVALREVLGNGLVTSDGEDWRRQRRLLQPAFSRQRLADYGAVMCEEAQREVEFYSDSEVVDISTRMMELTLRVVSRTLLGYSASSREAEDVRLAMKDMQDSVVSFGSFGPKWLSPIHRKRKRSSAMLDSVIYRLIAERRRSGPPSGPVDLLQMLVDARDEGDGRGLDDLEIRDQLVTLYIAGHETTSSALTWAFCIGKVFAQNEAVLVLATLAQKLRFDLEPGHPVELRSRVTLNPKHGMRMIAHLR